MNAFFERMDSLLKKKLEKKEISVQEMFEFMSHHRNEFPEYFGQGSNSKVLKNQSLTPGQMASQIINGKQFVKDIYDYYFKLSQFEHFTLITEQLMNENEHNSEMMYIVDVTNYLLDFLNINLGSIRAPLEVKTRAVELINEFRSTQWKI